MSEHTGGHVLRYYDPVGAAAKPFFQGMLNRLGVGSARYGARGQRQGCGYDYASSALLRIREAILTRNPEYLIDGANMLLLAWEKGEGFDAEADPADSPGAVGLDGRIVNARGRYAPTNGDVFEAGSAQVPDTETCLRALLRRHRNTVAILEKRFDDLETD